MPKLRMTDFISVSNIQKEYGHVEITVYKTKTQLLCFLFEKSEIKNFFVCYIFR